MENLTKTVPSVYVGTYGKYNSGSIAGEWVILDDCSDYDDFLEKCAEIHSDESDPEFMFQDFEGFPKKYYSESDLSKVFEYLEEISQLSEDEIEAFQEFLENGSGETVSDFQDCFQGNFSSMEAYAEHYLEETGELNEIPKHLQYYFDFKSYARDIELGGDAWISDSGNVFLNR